MVPRSNPVMPYKIEMRYAFRWDDAEWTVEDENGVKPMRFSSIKDAQQAIDDFFADVRDAVVRGDLDIEEDPEHYRIVVSRS